MLLGMLSGAVLFCACDLAVPSRHVPVKLMGKDYYTALYPHYDHNVQELWDKGSAYSVRFDNPELLALPAFADAVPVYHGQRKSPPPELGIATWRTLRENFCPGEPDAEILSSNPRPDRPLIVGFGGKRNVLSFGGKVDLDYDEWKAWRVAHPNLLFCWTHIEWDCEIPSLYRKIPRVRDAKRRSELEAFFGAEPKNRLERLEVQRKYYDRMKALYYDDPDVTAVMFASLMTGHVAAGFGAKHLIVETTNTSGGDTEYRWNLAPMFCRGAARQFGLDWQWYVAGVMNGWSEDDAVKSVETAYNCAATRYPHREGAKRELHSPYAHYGPEFGTSWSLLRRVLYLAYLSGANLVELEEWSAQLQMWDENARKTVLTPRGESFVRYHDFTREHPDRGTPFTPVAILVPYAQGYPTYGGHPWATASYGYTEGDHQVDAVFFSLVPGFERHAAMLNGVETNLHNSPHAMMYDVLCPDSPQNPSAFLEALKSYKVAVLVGDYPDRTFERQLQAFERAGGKVIRIDRTLVPPPRAAGAVAEVLSGREKFPKVDAVLSGLDREYFPFSIKGDCLYGANRTSRGWWVYVLNNRGVTKWADKPARLDPSAASNVRVSGRSVKIAKARELLSGRSVDVVKGEIRWTVPPGDLAVFEILDKR